MLDTKSLNLVQIDPTVDHIITHIASNVDIQHPAYANYLFGKFIVAREFDQRYPGYPINIIEPHDSESVVIVSRTGTALPNAVIRVCFDGKNALPITRYVHAEYEARKAQGNSVAEVGRLFAEPDSHAYRYLIACVYQLALYLNIDCYLIQIRTSHLSVYQNVFGAEIIDETTSCDGCTHMAWHIARTPSRFMRRYPVHAIELNEPVGAVS